MYTHRRPQCPLSPPQLLRNALGRRTLQRPSIEVTAPEPWRKRLFVDESDIESPGHLDRRVWPIFADDLAQGREPRGPRRVARQWALHDTEGCA